MIKVMIAVLMLVFSGMAIATVKRLISDERYHSAETWDAERKEEGDNNGPKEENEEGQ